MFRSDGLDGNNYHHAEMQTGNGSDNPAAFLASSQQITIYRALPTEYKPWYQKLWHLSPYASWLNSPEHQRNTLGGGTNSTFCTQNRNNGGGTQLCPISLSQSSSAMRLVSPNPSSSRVDIVLKVNSNGHNLLDKVRVF